MTAATLENDAPPVRAPTEPAGVLAGEPVPARSSSVASSAPATVESDAAPARAPTQPGGVLVGEASHDAPAAATPAASSAAVASSPEAPQRVVHLPARPRLRVSYWFDGAGALKCEATLMDERRNLVHRAHIDTTDPTASQIFSWIASRLVAELKAGGAAIAVPVSLAPEEETKP